MAVPTITSVTPDHGASSGGNWVEIVGTNFRLKPPPAYGRGGPLVETVRVFFGGFQAPEVRVWTSTTVGVSPPPCWLDQDLPFFPPVNVKLQNIGDDGNVVAFDDDGDPIPTEEVLAPEAYTYKREPLRMPTMGKESPFARLTRTLIQLIKREIVVEGGIKVHTDYSPDGIVVHDNAKVPSLFLTNQQVVEDAYGYENESYWDLQPDGSALCWPAPTMHTVTYDLMGASDFESEYSALMGAARKLARRNGYIVMPADVPAGVNIRMPFAMTADPSGASGDRNSNLNTFLAGVEVRRVPVVYLPPNLRTWPVDTARLDTQKLQGTLVETISLW